MNRPFARVLRLYAWLLLLHVWNGWKQNPFAWLKNLINLTRVVFSFFRLETVNAVDNAIAGEVEQLYRWVEQGQLTVPRLWLRRINQLHPYPETS